MKNIIRQLLVFFVFVVSLNLAAQTLPVITGQVKCQGRGVANVVVTNGFDCVSTDVAGKYTIPYHRDARFVYVTTPAGYLPQRDGSLPLFYQRITKGTSVYDFSLVKNSENFGPIYYSFNRGKAHYIVLDNCYYINRHYRYIGYIDERTLQWIEKDLAFVPKDHLVFVSMHIPSSSTKELEFNALLPDETSNASSLYDLLKGYEAHLLTGHTHNNGNVVFNDSLMEHNTAAVCGTFWKADICTDGTPAGYGVYEVDGNKLTWRYKSAGYPIEHQFRAYPVGVSEDYPEYILANVWNWDENWKVEWYENGKCMGEMEHFTGFDPEAKAICSDKKRVEYDWISPIKTEHMFRALPKNGSASMEVCVTDRFGNVYKVKL